MEQSSIQNSSNPPLSELISDALQQLVKLDFSRRSIRRYQAIWKHLSDFARQNDLDDKLSTELADRCIATYQSQEDEPAHSQRGWRRHVVFGIKMLTDFAHEGHIKRTRVDREMIPIPPAMRKTLDDYERYCLDKRYLRSSTMRQRLKEITAFLSYLDARGIGHFRQIQAVDITSFVISRQHFRPRTLARIVTDIRSFLRYLSLQGILDHDLSQVLPPIRIPKNDTIPSVWNPELVTRLLKSIDRSSGKGKRDYAILILASRLGLRAGDIRTLTLDNLDWEGETLAITQSKTGEPLRLPLTEEIGAALIDYLKSGRPQSEHRQLFLQLNPPFTPFGEDNHLYYILKYWKQLAGIQLPTRQRQGLHSLRHTLASQLLQAETPFHVIAEVLGHVSTTSTMIYAKADVENLRSAALDIAEVCDDKQ